MTERISITVLGDPQPQGSKTTVQRHGRRPIVLDDNPQVKPWRQAVAGAALDAMAGRDQLTGPIRMTATFVSLRPRGHYGTGRNADLLKASAPLYVRTRPDVDKLLRAVGDALTGIVYRDDSQVVIAHAEKHYGAPACVHLVIAELEPDNDRPSPDPLQP